MAMRNLAQVLEAAWFFDHLIYLANFFRDFLSIDLRALSHEMYGYSLTMASWGLKHAEV